MVCSAAILSSSLALSLLRHSAPPSESFLFSPYSFNTALSIVHDGAHGNTQQELTDVLLNGCTPTDVTAFYSSLAHSFSSSNESQVAFKSANRFYVDNSISLEKDYQKHVEKKYKVKVDNGIDLQDTTHAANEMNQFIEEATNGMIKNMIKADEIDDDHKAILINAIHFLGKWKHPFNPTSTHNGTFYGASGNREMEFMLQDEATFRVNRDKQLGTALIVPYQDEQYNLFYLIPSRDSNLETMRNSLTGESLLKLIREAKDWDVEIIVPKFKLESELDGVKALKKMGVNTVFSHSADLSKISSTHLRIDTIQHNAVIEIDEQGTKAAAATVHKFTFFSGGPPTIVIDRPFLFGTIRNEDILFLGQYV